MSYESKYHTYDDEGNDENGNKYVPVGLALVIASAPFVLVAVVCLLIWLVS